MAERAFELECNRLREENTRLRSQRDEARADVRTRFVTRPDPNARQIEAERDDLRDGIRLVLTPGNGYKLNAHARNALSRLVIDL